MGKWVLLRSQTAIKSTQLRAILYQQQRSELSVAPVVPVGLMHPVVCSHCTAHRPFFTFAPQAHVARQRRRRRRFVRFCRKFVSFLPFGLLCSGTGTRIWRCLEAEEGASSNTTHDTLIQTKLPAGISRNRTHVHAHTRAAP